LIQLGSGAVWRRCQNNRLNSINQSNRWAPGAQAGPIPRHAFRLDAREPNTQRNPKTTGSCQAHFIRERSFEGNQPVPASKGNVHACLPEQNSGLTELGRDKAHRKQQVRCPRFNSSRFCTPKLQRRRGRQRADGKRLPGNQVSGVRRQVFKPEPLIENLAAHRRTPFYCRNSRAMLV